MMLISIRRNKEWTDALDSVITQEGADRAHFLIER
jgi:pyruvate dehydrogenase complex dehydrogenase (E1) component